MSDLTIPVVTPDHDKLSAALAYAKAGWYIGPERRGTRDPGSVLGKGWQHKTSRDPQVITSWFAGTNHGVFLHAGRSGAVIIDVDTPENLHPAIKQAIDQYNPPFQSTRPDQPGRGHYIFAVPDSRRFGNSLGDLGKGWGEIRGPKRCHHRRAIGPLEGRIPLGHHRPLTSAARVCGQPATRSHRGQASRHRRRNNGIPGQVQRAN
jgi:hypothetical protein